MNPVRAAALAAQEQVVRELREKHKAMLPEREPFFRALYELGMVGGWRAILFVKKTNEGAS